MAVGQANQPQESPPLHDRHVGCKSISLFIEAYFVAHTSLFA